MPHPSPFSGLWIPLVTPFRDGAVDHPALAALTRRLRADGVDGLVACGSTGEAAALSLDEQSAVLDTVLEAADGLPVVCGIGGASLAEVRHQLHAMDRGAQLAGWLLSAPHYVRPSQAGIRAWFQALADEARQPVIVYDIPYRTGAVIARDTLLALAEHPNIAALKDCGGEPAKTLALIAQGRLQVMAGEDLQIFATVAQGGSGAIAASAHLATPRFVALLQALRDADLTRARALWQPLVPWIEAAFSEPNPGPVKALLAASGAMTGELRLPMLPADAERLAPLQARIAALTPQAPLSRQ